MNHYYKTLLQTLKQGNVVRKTRITGEGVGDEALFVDEQMVASLGTKVPLWKEQETLTEKLSPTIELVICGGGHVAQELYKMALLLQMEVSILDERKEFCNSTLFPQARLFCAPFRTTLQEDQGWIQPYFVIVTRGHSFDQTCLESTLTLPHAYIGMIGSKHKVAITLDALHQKGFPKEALREVYTPIGLAIGASTAAEIAISILAQIISIYRKERGSVRVDPHLLRVLGERMGYILARVVMKRGSAPCEVGFQLAMFRDGTTQGTVGGGLIEAKAITFARQMLCDTTIPNSVVTYNLDKKEAGVQGMICGGEVSLLFQRQ